LELNELWERRIKDSGADFVCFVDTSVLPPDIAAGYACAILFGKTLSREYIKALRDGQKPKTNEVVNAERKMDVLAVKIADQLDNEGYKSIGKLKTGLLPHKTVALRAGLGFIGKNNLLITNKYGCALMLGKVLTTAPFAAISTAIKKPQCGDCNICVDACATKALLGKTWSVKTTREEIIIRKLCALCLQCMVRCRYTEEYVKQA
jgi:epoxyqueuosine reductase QueG